MTILSVGMGTFSVVMDGCTILSVGMGTFSVVMDGCTILSVGMGTFSVVVDGCTILSVGMGTVSVVMDGNTILSIVVTVGTDAFCVAVSNKSACDPDRNAQVKRSREAVYIMTGRIEAADFDDVRSYIKQ